MEDEAPKTAFVLSLIGGIFILIGGAAMAAVGALFGSFLSFFPGGFKALIALFYVGLALGFLTIAMSVLMMAAPRLKSAWGAITIVLAILSLPFALGGFLLGFLLTLIGGILAITYKPPMQMQPPQSFVQPTQQY